MPQIAASLSDVANVAAERKTLEEREAPEGEEAETLRVRREQEGGVGRTSSTTDITTCGSRSMIFSCSWCYLEREVRRVTWQKGDFLLY
jgi:hypothetical protein